MVSLHPLNFPQPVRQNVRPQQARFGSATPEPTAKEKLLTLIQQYNDPKLSYQEIVKLNDQLRALRATFTPEEKAQTKGMDHNTCGVIYHRYAMAEKDPFARNNLIDQAHHHFKTALQADPTNPVYLYNRSFVAQDGWMTPAEPAGFLFKAIENGLRELPGHNTEALRPILTKYLNNATMSNLDIDGEQAYRKAIEEGKLFPVVDPLTPSDKPFIDPATIQNTQLNSIHRWFDDTPNPALDQFAQGMLKARLNQ